MRLMRLCKRQYAEAHIDSQDPESETSQWNSGFGAAVRGARWNSKGNCVVYTSDSAALSVLEYVVHVEDDFPNNLVLLEIEIPDSLDFVLASPWCPREEEAMKRIGDEWLSGLTHPVLKVPSLLAPKSFNYLLNPKHRRAREIRLIDTNPFTFDSRILPKK